MTLAEFREKTRRPPPWAWCIFAAVLIGLLGNYRSQAIDDARALETEAATENERILRNQQNGLRIEEDRARMEAALKTMEERLVGGGDRAQNLRYFYLTVEESGASVLNVSQLPPPAPAAAARGPARPAGAYAAVPFQLVVNGSFHDVVSLLAGLHYGHHFCRINAVSIDRVDTGVNATISLDLLGRK